jgi:hypothetical protein
MAAASKFNVTVQNFGNGVHNLNSDTLKLALTNTAPVATNTLYNSNISSNELSGTNGYTTGGTAVGSTAYSQTGGLATLTGANVVFTATGSMGPFRYAVLYDSSVTNGPLLLFWDYGSSITLNAAETFTWSLTSNQILTLQ